MSSIIPGYEYDIFISYRQKDNKGDRWVSEFVEALKTELESTFKEEVSVYFDFNPHDGLLETHDVDASLKEKLKCLVFIPVISRTYCDPKSFAWENEFKAFIEQASKDTFGLKVKVPGGNVANRVLPVQIHELDPEDKDLLEKELGGVLRGIEFIYKEPGVNRPLTQGDEEKRNLNNTRYRNQINKVANAIKEIITGLRNSGREGKGISKEIIMTKPDSRYNLKPGIIAGTFISLVLIVLGYLFIPKLFESSKPLEKSIAVLPFFNDSPDEENTHFINGIMDEVLNNLQAIKDLRVISRTSVEQYRGTAKPTIPEIAKRLDVNYIVEGSGQKYGNTIRLRVQLIEAIHDRHLWAKSYENEIKETKDIFMIQSQIAQAIAAELKAIITPEEKVLIEKSPATSLTAYDFYQRGRDEHVNYWMDNSDRGALIKAENLYHKALANDSTFARAYSGLALVYVDKNTYSKTSYFSKNYLDSALILADRALLYDNQLAEAYYARAAYYFFIGKTEQASKEAYKALEYNPNYWEIYRAAGMMFLNDINSPDFVKGIESLDKAVSINRGRELSFLLRDLGGAYSWSAGFLEKANYYNLEALKLDGDSASFYNFLAKSEWLLGNFKGAAEYYNRCYAIDSNNRDYPFVLGECYMFMGMEKKSLKFYKKYDEKLKASGEIRLGGMHRIGYAYWKIGFKKEAEYYFSEQKKQSEESIRMNRAYATLGAYYDLAGVFAFKGEKEKAYENLKIWAKMPVFPLWLVTLIKNDPLFNGIRNEPEFLQIVREVEAKYQAEHERVGKWIEENGMH